MVNEIDKSEGGHNDEEPSIEYEWGGDSAIKSTELTALVSKLSRSAKLTKEQTIAIQDNSLAREHLANAEKVLRANMERHNGNIIPDAVLMGEINQELFAFSSAMAATSRISILDYLIKPSQEKGEKSELGPHAVTAEGGTAWVDPSYPFTDEKMRGGRVELLMAAIHNVMLEKSQMLPTAPSTAPSKF